MKAKVLGRLELLAWINFITMSDYPNIEQLSDGVAFCQLFDAFFPKTIDILKIKCKNCFYSQLIKGRRLGEKFWYFK